MANSARPFVLVQGKYGRCCKAVVDRNPKTMEQKSCAGGGGYRGGGLGLMNARRGQRWCPDKGSVHEPAWHHGKPSFTVL
jgi:hypothetical protein